MAEDNRARDWVARRLRERSDEAVAALLPVLDGGAPVSGVDPGLLRLHARALLERALHKDPSGEERWGHEARANLLTTLSHDVRGPLSTVSLSAMVLRRTSTDPQMLRSIDRIERATGAALAILEDLCHLAQLESGCLHLELAPLALADALREAARRSREGVRTFHMDVVAGPCPATLHVAADGVYLQRALAKLISHAVRYGAPGATVTLSADYGSDERHAVLSVEDDVESTPAPVGEDDDDVFERFFRTPSRGPGGTGLELALAKGFIEAHGGRIWSEPARGQGTRVCFSLVAA